MFKRIILFISLLSLFISLNIIDNNPYIIVNASIESTLINITNPGTDGNIIENEIEWFSILASILNWFKDTLSSILYVIWIWVFIFIWIRLATARWNPEEFKKAINQFIYAVLWIFVVTIAWASVKLVSWVWF